MNSQKIYQNLILKLEKVKKDNYVDCAVTTIGKQFATVYCLNLSDLPMVRGWQTHDRYLLAGQIQELMAKVLSFVSQIYSIQLVAEREAGSLL